MKEETQREDWIRLLEVMVKGFRMKYPTDKRSDYQLCEDLMRFFEKGGIVHRRGGKWVVPLVLDHEVLIRKIEADFN